MKRFRSCIIGIPVFALIAISCSLSISRNQEMAGILDKVYQENASPMNPFSGEVRIRAFDSVLSQTRNSYDSLGLEFQLSNTYLETGQEDKAIAICENLLKRIPPKRYDNKLAVMKTLAIAYLRAGERSNCIKDHSGQSCIMPISGRGVHQDLYGSSKAIEIYEEILKYDQNDYESRWLLNIAYMTVGKYPSGVPAHLLIKGLEGDTASGIKPFTDVAMNIGINTNNMAGGSIIDDFNNDGHLDLITSSWGLKQSMHYCRNNGNGSFTDVSDSSGLHTFTGGLNIMQTDYNNDGFKDVFVLRGAWKNQFGKEPNSLLRNNGDGTFTDVTIESGLLSYHPTQTATWADFNNDGWLDLFIGNESSDQYDPNPCELFISNGNGTFTEQAKTAGCGIIAYVKAVSSGDFDNDGKTDVFVSTLNGRKILLKNETGEDNKVQFRDVTVAAGLHRNHVRTFPTWFWDYDNDGWLDILICGYAYDKPLSWYAAQEAVGEDPGPGGKIFLYHNNQKGGFEDVSKTVGLDKIAFAMGSNFGDINNDGFLDFYLGTGNPQYQSLVPNKLFLNINGESFKDITAPSRMGNLQKGHGVSFADLDNDGDADVYIEMGGAYDGDGYQNSLYLNPGQTKFNWINLSLQGTTSNKAAIGARIKVTINDRGKSRQIYRDVNSGGSFGSNPLLQHIGIGEAAIVESVEIRWPGKKELQVLKNLPVNQQVNIQEGKIDIALVSFPKVDFLNNRPGLIGCSPSAFIARE